MPLSLHKSPYRGHPLAWTLRCVMKYHLSIHHYLQTHCASLPMGLCIWHPSGCCTPPSACDAPERSLLRSPLGAMRRSSVAAFSLPSPSARPTPLHRLVCRRSRPRECHGQPRAAVGKKLFEFLRALARPSDAWQGECRRLGLSHRALIVLQHVPARVCHGHTGFSGASAGAIAQRTMPLARMAPATGDCG